LGVDDAGIDHARLKEDQTVNALRIVTLAALGLLMAGGQALAVAGHGPVWNADFVAAYQPQFGNTQSPPYTGDLKLSFNHGIITGTYSSISARPDPYYGRIIQVTGGVKGTSINLRIGSISLPNGTMSKSGTISGTANWNGKLYNFMAKPRPSGN
jgi:hypothetical protein